MNNFYITPVAKTLKKIFMKIALSVTYCKQSVAIIKFLVATPYLAWIERVLEKVASGFFKKRGFSLSDKSLEFSDVPFFVI